MMEIEKPKIAVEENENKSYAKVVVEPLEKGFGLTIGNALRRILLSALPGAAIQTIKFDGANIKHEFSAVPGVKEDVTEIILNLKTVNIKTASLDQNYKKTVRLYKQGPAVVTAGDIEADAEVEILNPDVYICTIGEGYTLDMELSIGRGRGYQDAKFNKTEEIGTIAIDSIYTPVKKVSYNVENSRVGESVDYDKLVLEVWTNGAFSGKDVVSLSAKILEEYIKMFVDLSEIGSAGILVAPKEDKKSKLLEMKLEELGLSNRSFNCMNRIGVKKVEDLVQKTESEINNLRNIGEKSLTEIKEKLESLGLSFRKEEE